MSLGVRGLAVQDNMMFWATHRSSGKIYSACLDGTNQTVIVDGVDKPLTVAVDSQEG